MPVFSRPRPVRLGRRPVAISVSAASVQCSSLFLSSKNTFPPAIRLTLHDRWKSIPRRSICFLTRFAMSSSRVLRHSFKYSITVILQPKLFNMDANSMPMTPAPMMHRLAGSSVSDNSRSLVMTASDCAPSIGGMAGCEPVAIMMLRAVYDVSPTMTVCAS